MVPKECPETLWGEPLKTYLYPQNLKAKANLWLWSLRDFLIFSIAVLTSAVIFLNSGLLFPAALSLSYGFLTIRNDETAVVDFISIPHSEKCFWVAAG